MPETYGPDVEQLREMAQNQGFKLERSRVRTPGRKDYGKFGLIAADGGEKCFGFGKRGLTASASEIEEYLRGRSAGRWRQSADSKGGTKKAANRKKDAVTATVPAPARRERSKPARAPSEPVPDQPRPAESRSKAEDRAATPREIRIRAAKPADAPAIASLIRELKSGSPSRALKQLISAQARWGLPLQVADNGQVVGAASAVLIQAPHRAQPIGRIATIVVAKDCRRQGVGSKLLAALEALLRRKGCSEMEATADPDFSGVGAFFRARGYDRSTYRFEGVAVNSDAPC